MASSARRAEPADYPRILRALRRNPGRHAWAIQDLTVWDKATSFVFDPASFSDADPAYLLHTGHPGAQRNKSLILDGTPIGVSPLLTEIPLGPWLMRETPATLAPILQSAAPAAKIYLEERMEVTRATFKPAHQGHCRRLTDADAEALAVFRGAPPAAAPMMLLWIRGAIIFGLFDGPKLLATASSFVRIPDAWMIVGVVTARDQRGKGFGREVTSALTATALEHAPVVTLTVVKDNAPAKRLYERLGYQTREDRIWVDNGVEISPVED